MSDSLNILIVAGGTGGHITPGLGLAHELYASNREQVQVHFLSIERNRSFADFKDLPFALHFYDAPRLPRSPGQLPGFPWALWKAYRAARQLIRTQAIDLVIGMGGYSTLPALLAARLSGIPYSLCEQNAIPGRATRSFAAKARQFYLSLPIDKDSPHQLPQKKIQFTGNPLRPALLAEHQKLHQAGALLKSRGFKTAKNLKKFNILVLGGSQGAQQLNHICQAVIPELLKKYPGIEFGWDIQCGEKHLDDMRNALPEKDYPDVRLFGYHTHVAELYARADVLIARSGAGVICEGALFGLPMILVPYPYAQDDHQLANARYFAGEGAACLIDRRDNNPDELLAQLQAMLDDASLRRNMAERSALLARPDAASKIALAVLKSIDRGAGS